MPPKKSLSSNAPRKTDLKTEEIKQLESFIKHRSVEVDAEIEELRTRLKIHNLSLPAEISAFEQKKDFIPVIIDCHIAIYLNISDPYLK